MTDRISRTSRTIRAKPDRIYAAFLDPDQLVRWLPPGGMTGRIHAFDGRVSGGYRMSLYYPSSEGGQGKTAENEDQVEVRFTALEPPHRIVEAVTFVTEDAALKGEMTMTVTIEPAREGSHVTLHFIHLPPGLSPEANDEGARLSLEQLARAVEGD